MGATVATFLRNCASCKQNLAELAGPAKSRSQARIAARNPSDTVPDMKFFSFLCGLLALPLAASPATARGDGLLPETAIVDDSPFEIFPVARFAPEMAGGEISGDAGAEPPVLLAQSGDPRIVGLEEQIRQLNGRVEEMNFQILQMQEQMRKMQEDVDFRLQELEQKRTDAGGKSPRPASETKAAEAPPVAQPAPRQNDVAAATPREPAPGPGAPEKPLGSIVFDGEGNVKGGSLQLPPPSQPGEAVDDGEPDSETVVASLPSTSDPQELYRNSYEFILSGDYGTAEAGFREYIDRFPGETQSADAHYWLGEALLGQQRYRDAAEVFVAANQEYPNARKSPDMLLKLGVSMAALNQRDVACATFGKIGQRYPKISPSLKERVKQEQALAGC